MDLEDTEWSQLSFGDSKDADFGAFHKQDESSQDPADFNSFVENSQNESDPTLPQTYLYGDYDSCNESGQSSDNDYDMDDSLQEDPTGDGIEKVSEYQFLNNQDGMASCEHCGSVGARDTFHSKSKRFCSLSCSKRYANLQRSGDRRSRSSGGKPLSKKKSQSNQKIINQTENKRVFNWGPYLISLQVPAAPVSCFKHVPMNDHWDQMSFGVLVEVPNTDWKSHGQAFWIATIIKIYGYKVLLRYEGFGSDGSKDFWGNLLSEDVHNVGWCATYGKILAPPHSIRDKYPNWRDFLINRLTGTRTIPSNFCEKAHEWVSEQQVKPGMYLEVVDKMCVSAMRVATVKETIGCRLRLFYVDSVDQDEFWCHMNSALLHPIGWSHTTGHKLHASHDYIRSCMTKAAMNRYGPQDTTPDMFPKMNEPPHGLNFQVGMKLEAIDPLNLSAICVATVMKVLRNNYLMIGIDGSMAVNGSDWFCYHATSPCIFPVGFCEINNLKLTPPRDLDPQVTFNWFDYLRDTCSMAAPVKLFDKEIPKHGFRPGMKVEAVDLMEPRLICVATVSKVVGRLLRIHFDGWEDNYDQWVDCFSPDIYPVGWCEAMGHSLEGPHGGGDTQLISPVVSKKRKGKSQFNRSSRKKRGSAGSDRRSRENGRKVTSPPAAYPSHQLSAVNNPEDVKYPPHKMLSPEVVAASLPPLLESDVYTKPDPDKTEVSPPVLSPLGGNRSMHYTTPESAERTTPEGVKMESERRIGVPPSTPTSYKERDSSGSSLVLTLSSRLRELPLNRWTLSDIVDVLKVNGCAVYVSVFNEKEINGARLAALSSSDLQLMFLHVDGSMSRLCDLVDKVKSATKFSTTVS